MVRVQHAFDAFNGNKVLIIGDVMVDAYQWGDVHRISPEAPVPVLSSTKKEMRLGGAANVALNIKALGGIPIVCSVIGSDHTGAILKHLFEETNEISTHCLLESDERITTRKTRVLSNYQQLLRIDEESDQYLSEGVEREFIALIKHTLEHEDISAVIFEDYDKGVITPLLIDEITSFCAEKGIITLCDPKHRNFNFYKQLTVFKPNFKEFCSGINRRIAKDDFEQLILMSKGFRKLRDFKNLIVTLSEHGVLVDGDTTEIIPAQKRDISDVSGAGDTVISVLTMGLCAGLNIVTASKVANIAGGLVCEKIGIVPINKKQLIDECSRLFFNGVI